MTIKISPYRDGLFKYCMDRSKPHVAGLFIAGFGPSIEPIKARCNKYAGAECCFVESKE